MYYNKKIFRDDLIEAMKRIKAIIKYCCLKIVIAISITVLPYYLGKYGITLMYGAGYTHSVSVVWVMGMMLVFIAAEIIVILIIFSSIPVDAYKRYFKKPAAINNRLDKGGSE